MAHAETNADWLGRWARSLLAHRQANRTPPQRPSEIFQTSTIAALLDGVYDGNVTIADLLRHGDFGLGTFNHLDGEMVILEGICYHLRSDGSATVAASTERTPFAAVTRFQPSRTVSITEPSTRGEMISRIDAATDSDNLMYALKITGRFADITTRTVAEQKRPYPQLITVTEQQAETHFTDVSGTLCGFRMPSYDEGISVAGYHLHFLDANHTLGGHALNFTLQQAEVHICTVTDLHLSLPRTPEFEEAHLDAADMAEQIHHTEGGS